jgi:hypothetical protein
MHVSSSLAGSSTSALTTAPHDDLEGARCVAPASSPEPTRTPLSPVPSPSLWEDTSMANTSYPSSLALPPTMRLPPSPPPRVCVIDAHARPAPASTPSSRSATFGTLPLGPPQRHQLGSSMAPQDPSDPRWGIHGAHRRRRPCPLPHRIPHASRPTCISDCRRGQPRQLASSSLSITSPAPQLLFPKPSRPSQPMVRLRACFLGKAIEYERAVF